MTVGRMIKLVDEAGSAGSRMPPFLVALFPLAHFSLLLYQLYSVKGVKHGAWYLALSALSTMFDYDPHGRIRQVSQQRDMLNKIRLILADSLNLPHLRDVKQENWDIYRGWMFGPPIYLLMTSVHLIFLMAEGKFLWGLHLVIVVSYVIVAWWTGSKNNVCWAVRFTGLIQFSSMLLRDDNTNGAVARRAMAFRVVCALTSMESLTELFFHLVVVMTIGFAFQFGVFSSMFWLPSLNFVLVVAPMEVLGLRSILAKAASSRLPTLSVSNALALVMCFLSGCFFFSSFHSPFHVNSLLMIICSLAAGATLYVHRRFVNLIIHPSMLDDQYCYRPGGFDMDARQEYFLVPKIMFVVFLGLLARRLYGLASAVAIIAWITRTHLKKKRRKLLLCILGLVFVHPSIHQDEVAILGLASLKMWLSFEYRCFSDIVVESLMLGAIQLIFTPQRLQTNLLFMNLSGIILALAICLNHENAFRLMRVAKNADSFLDHALKQKYSSVGAAITQALETTTCDPTRTRLLRNALGECQAGQHICFLSSYATRYKSGAPIDRRDRGLVKQTMQDWLSTDDEFTFNVVFQETAALDYAEIALDWHVFKILILDVKHRCDRSHQNEPIHVSLLDNNCLCVRIGDEHVVRLSAHPFFPIYQAVASALGCTIRVSSITVPYQWASLPLPVSARTSPMMAYSSLSPSPRTPLMEISRTVDNADFTQAAGSQLPRDLTFAILDDSNLVRKATMALVKRFFGVSSKSFTTGEFPDDVERFIEKVLDTPDIAVAIVDENLEYHNHQVIKGTDVAIQLRERGFRNCLILHSAHADMRLSLHPAFNGFLEKTSCRTRIVDGITHIWNDFSGLNKKAM